MELAEEQAYFDRAHKHRERRLATIDGASSAAANAGAAQRLRAWAKGKRERAKSAPEAVAFGRIDDESVQSLYIGHEVITDEDHEVLVVNWQAPAAAPYYQATHEDPLGLTRKRSFVCDGNQITDFADVVFRQLAQDVAALEAFDGPDKLLFAELDAARDGAMHDIVATIQAAQYDLIRSPMAQVLVIEGGPGTGKTAVALHRVSWLLYNHRDQVSATDVLVVGPNPAFIRYIRTVLPDLGNGEVQQSDIGQLAPPVPRGRPEPAEVRRLKGDERMARLLARALEARIGTPEPAERMMFEGRFVTLTGVEVAAVVRAGQEASGRYAQRRALVRARLLDLARERGAPTDRGRLEPVDDLVERLWPQFSAPAFLRDLLGSQRRLLAAADRDMTPDEVALLRRRGADRLSEQVWSTADLPLLDEVDDLLNGVSRRYGHIVVDEAQDLSPMQLRSISRRSATGSMTIVGDLAQSTGPWARDDWAGVLRHLPDTLPQAVVALRYGYRVPRQVYDLAAQLLPLAAPGSAPLTVVRDAPTDPFVHRVEAADRPGRVVAVAMEHAAEGRYVGVVCPSTHRSELAAALAAGQVRWSSADSDDPDALVSLVDPEEAKGLEFDAVVVVEPEDIVAGDERGHRMLFIALTRTTRYLDIVCAGEPLPLFMPAPRRIPQPRSEPDPDVTVDMSQVDVLAQQIAAAISTGAPAQLWYEVLHRVAEELDRQQAQGNAAPTGRHQRHD
jgi:DNA helicase IV